MDDVLRSLRPPPHFKQREAIEQQCRGWSLRKLNAALARIAEAAKAARLNSALEGTLAERLLLDLGALRKGQDLSCSAPPEVPVDLRTGPRSHVSQRRLADLWRSAASPT